MPNSLRDPDFQAIFDRTKQTASKGGLFPSPEDWRDLWIYFLMVDRFNNKNAKPNHTPFDDPNFFGFQGGKFSGIVAQLPYLKSLGVGALWLSPVLKNLPFDEGTYHGYGIHDFLSAEPRFADDPAHADDELRALVDAAHKQGIFVIFDIVLNHVGDVFAYTGGQATANFSQNPQPIFWRDANGNPDPTFTVVENIPIAMRDRNSLVWPSELQQNRFFRRQGKPGGDDDTVGDFESLKQMVTADPDLQRFLIRAYQYVIARYDVDGFRIDTLRYLKGDLARIFGNAVREFALQVGKKNFFTYGEVLDGHAEDDIARFIGRSTTDGSDMVGVDAALDYPLFNVLKPMVKGFTAPESLVGMYHRRKVIEQDILSSHGEATAFFVTFLDNHDMKERIRFVQPGDPHRFDDQVTLGLACLYALPGIPCLYYGTEQGLHGAGSDPAVREALWGVPGGFDTQNFFYQQIQKLVGVREARASMRYGRFYFRPVSGDGVNFSVSNTAPGVLAFSRILNDEETVVVANAGTGTVSLDVILDVQLSSAGDTYRVFYSNKVQPTSPAKVRQTGLVNVQEVDGTFGHGPLHVLRVVLQPLEAQILGL